MAKVKENRDNLQVNGNFDFWQRGTTFSNAAQNTYTADRWMSQNGSTNTVNVTRQDISALVIGSSFCLRSERSTGTGTWGILSHFENSTLRRLYGKKVTFTFLLRKGSALTSDVTAAVQTTNTEASGGSVVDAMSLVIPNASINTSSFTKFNVTLDIPLASAAIGMRVSLQATQTGAANAYFEVTQVMFNEGASPMPFVLAGRSIASEFLRCQRYYEKSYDYGTALGTITNANRILITCPSGGSGGTILFKVTKRSSAPTVVHYSPTTGAANNVRNVATNTDQAASVNTIGDSISEVQVTGISAGQGFVLHFTADAEL